MPEASAAPPRATTVPRTVRVVTDSAEFLLYPGPVLDTWRRITHCTLKHNEAETDEDAEARSGQLGQTRRMGNPGLRPVLTSEPRRSATTPEVRPCHGHGHGRLQNPLNWKSRGKTEHRGLRAPTCPHSVPQVPSPPCEGPCAETAEGPAPGSGL